MKNKIFCFVFDLFKNGDKEEQAGIFAQVKIYRSTSARVFEFIVGILVLSMWLLTIRNIIHATSDDLPYLLLLAGMGTFSLLLVCFTAIIQRPMTFLLSRLSMPDRYITCPCWIAMQLYGQPSSGYGLVVWILSEVSLYLWVE